MSGFGFGILRLFLLGFSPYYSLLLLFIIIFVFYPELPEAPPVEEAAPAADVQKARFHRESLRVGLKEDPGAGL